VEHHGGRPAGAPCACDNDAQMHEPMKVTLTEMGLAGDYIVAERHADGS
jgi:hypothetical protein